MAIPNSNLNEIITTTLRNRTGKLADNVSKSRALLERINKKGNVRKFVGGGRSIVQELEYAENGTFRRYAGYDLLNVAPSDVMTGAEFDIKQAAVAVSISGLEMLQNQGSEAVIDLMAARIKNAERTLMNNIAADCFSDGTADSGKQIGGLQALVSTSPSSGTVGGISASTNTFWRNFYYACTTTGGAGVSASNIQKYMTTVAINLVRGTDAPDLIVADDTMFSTYTQSMQAIQRVTAAGSEGGVGAGFPSLKFWGGGANADVVLERSSGLYANAGMPSTTMFFLNTDYIYFRPHADRNFVVEDGNRTNANQDALVKLIFWAGNMTIGNRALQGVMNNS